MRANDFKKWMQENDVTEVDIAAFLKIHPVTITRFLNGECTPRRSTLNGYQRFMAYCSMHKKQALARDDQPPS